MTSSSLMNESLTHDERERIGEPGFELEPRVRRNSDDLQMTLLFLLMLLFLLLLLFSLLSHLSQAGLLGGDVAPLLDDGLLDLPGVGAGPGADLLGDVNALLLGLEERNQLGDVLARSLGLQVAVFLRHLGKKFKPG